MKEANYMIVLSNSIFSFMGWTKGNAVVRAKSDFTHVASIYFFIVTKESRFTKEMGLSWYRNMAAVALFLNTKMAART